MLKGFFVLILVATALGFPQEKADDNVDDILTAAFGPEKATTERKPSEGTLDDLIADIFKIEATTKKAEIGASVDETGKECGPSNVRGICVRYYLCENDAVVTTNNGEIDIAGGLDAYCESYLDTCCKKEGVIAKTGV